MKDEVREQKEERKALRGRDKVQECEMCFQYIHESTATMKAMYRLVGANCKTRSCQAVWLL